MTLAAGETAGTIAVPVLGDTVDEADETFAVELSDGGGPDALVVLRPRAVARVIDDDGPAVLSVLDAQVAEGDGPGEALVTVSLSSVSGKRVSASWSALEASSGAPTGSAATAGEDFTAASGTVVLDPATTEAAIRVPLPGDRVNEPDETFLVRLSSPSAAVLGRAEATVTLRDDDPVELSVGDLSVVEGDAGTTEGRFPVTLSVPSVFEIAVSWSTSDLDALAGVDYQPSSGTLTFAPGATRADAVVPVLGDTLREPVETFLVTLAAPASSGGSASLADPEAVGSIVDDDGILVSVADVTARESAGAEAVFQVGLNKPTTVDVSVAYATADGTATAGADYTATSGSVTIPAGASAVDVSVPLVDDAVFEPSETFSVELANPSGDAILLDAAGEATVLDDDGWFLNGAADDAAILGCIVLTPDVNNRRGSAWQKSQLDLARSFDKTMHVYLGERDSGADGIYFALQSQGPTALGGSGGSEGYLPIRPSIGFELDTFTDDRFFQGADHLSVGIDGSEHAGHQPVELPVFNIEDGQEHDLRIVWNALTKTFGIHFDGSVTLVYPRDVISDVFDGATEVFWGMTGGTGGRSNLQYFCDSAQCVDGVEAQVSVGDTRVVEGDPATSRAHFPLTLSCPVDQPVTVSYRTVDGSALVGEDYLPASGSVTFSAGETSKDIVVEVVGETAAEIDETFFLDLSAPVGGGIRYGRGVGTILTDDHTVEVPEVRRAEGDVAGSTVAIPVVLESPAAETIRVDYATADGTATAGSDYGAVTGSVSFAPGETEKEIMIPWLGDLLDEGDEQFFLELSTTSERAQIADPRPAVTVLDDDRCPQGSLLVNGSADEPLVDGEISGWVEAAGSGWTVRTAAPGAFSGKAAFDAGTASEGELRQDVDVSAYAGRIDRGIQPIVFEGFVRSGAESPADTARVLVEYRDADNAQVLDSFDSGDLQDTDGWHQVADMRTIPAGTRWVRVRLLARRTGSDGGTDALFDALALRSLATPVLDLGQGVVTEGDAGSQFLEVPVTLNCPVEETVTASYATQDRSALTGVDYVPASGTVTLGPGETATTVPVEVLGDTELELEERFDLLLADVSGAVLVDPVGSGLIRDDDNSGAATKELRTFWIKDLRIFAWADDTEITLVDIDTGLPLSMNDSRISSTNVSANPFVLEHAGDSFEGIARGNIRVRVIASDPSGAGQLKPITVWTGRLSSGLRHPAQPPTGNPWASYIPAFNIRPRANGRELGDRFLGFTSRELTLFVRKGAEPTRISVEDLATNVDPDADDSDVLGPEDAAYADGEIEIYFLDGFEDDTVRISSNAELSVLAGLATREAPDWTVSPPSYAAGDEGIELGTEFYTFAHRSLTVFPVEDDTTVTITDLSDGDDSQTFTLAEGDTSGPYELFTPVLDTRTGSGIVARTSDPAVTILSTGNAFDDDYVKVESDKPVLVYVGPAGSDVNEFGDVAFSVPTGPESRIIYCYAQDGGGQRDLQIFGFTDDTRVEITSLSYTAGFNSSRHHDFVVGPGIGGSAGWLTGKPGQEVWWGTGVWAGEMLRIESNRPIVVINGDYDNPHFGAFIPFLIDSLSLPPVADAGLDRTATAGETVTLDGTGSFDQDDVSGTLTPRFEWDLDLGVDTDGDGNPADDVDATGPTPQQVYLVAGVHTAELTFFDDEGESDTDQVRVTVAPHPLSLTKAADVPTVAPGGEIGYELIVTNGGDAPVDQVVLRDAIPQHASLAGPVTTSQGAVVGTSPIEIDLGTLTTGASAQVSFRVTVEAPLDPAVEAIENRATARAAGLPPFPSDDPATPEPFDPTVTPVEAPPVDLHPALTATKMDALALDADGDGVPSPGDEIAYTIEITNTGGAPATEVTLTDLVPENLSVVPGSVEASAGSVVGESPVEVSLGELPAGASATVTFRGAVDLPLPAGVDRIANQGTVTSAELPAVLTDDPDLGGDADPTVTMLTAAPELVAEKADRLAVDADGDGAVSPGDQVEYTVTVRNVGNTAATGVGLADPVPDHVTIVPGSVNTSQGSVDQEASSVVVTLGEIGGGADATVRFRVTVENPIPAGVRELSNQGLVASAELPDVVTDDPEVDGAADPTATPVVAAPEVLVEKGDSLFEDVGGDGLASPGDVLLYRITVANVGNTPATSVVLTDAIPEHTVLEPGTLQASDGTVMGDDPVAVEVGQLDVGDEVVVTFRLRIDDPFPLDVLEISNQAEVASAELELVLSDDPDAPGDADPTVTPVFIVPEIVVGDVTVGENAGPASFSLTLSEASNRPVKVPYATADGADGIGGSGTSPATAGLDYLAAFGTVVFAPGETARTVPVEVLDDALDELDETFTLSLTPSSGEVEGGVVADGSGLGTIVDDDPPPFVSIGDATVVEGDPPRDWVNRWLDRQWGGGAGLPGHPLRPERPGDRHRLRDGPRDHGTAGRGRRRLRAGERHALVPAGGRLGIDPGAGDAGPRRRAGRDPAGRAVEPAGRGPGGRRGARHDRRRRRGPGVGRRPDRRGGGRGHRRRPGARSPVAGRRPGDPGRLRDGRRHGHGGERLSAGLRHALLRRRRDREPGRGAGGGRPLPRAARRDLDHRALGWKGHRGHLHDRHRERRGHAHHPRRRALPRAQPAGQPGGRAPPGGRRAARLERDRRHRLAAAVRRSGAGGRHGLLRRRCGRLRRAGPGRLRPGLPSSNRGGDRRRSGSALRVHRQGAHLPREPAGHGADRGRVPRPRKRRRPRCVRFGRDRQPGRMAGGLRRAHGAGGHRLDPGAPDRHPLRRHHGRRLLRRPGAALTACGDADGRRRDGLLAGLRNLLSSPQEDLREQGLARLEAQAAAIEAKLAANPFGDRAAAVKAGYAPERAEAFLRTVAALAAEASGPEAGPEGTGGSGSRLAPSARKALLTALRSELDAGLTFEPPGNERADLPAPARQRSQRLQGQLTALLAKLHPILNAPDALSEEKLARTVERVAAAVGDEVAIHQRPPRSPDRPLPIQPVERKAKRAAAGEASVAQSSSAFVPGASGSGPKSIASRSTLASRAAGLAPEITALATEPGTPAKIFAHVHDTIRFDPKWGAVRSPLGTLLEGEGTAWDQAWLLHDLLTAVGIDARFEWGEIEIPVDLLTNLTGVSDPFRAGDLLATGGVPTLLLVDGGRVVGARISHVWVKAHVDYIPNRGATPTDAAHPADSWIRMDPSLKRTDYAQGLDVHQNVPFEVGSYLESATALSPRRAYEDALWEYIDTHDIQCTTLELLKDQGTVRVEGFPILPGTLRGRILSVAGEAAAVPAEGQERVRIETVSAGGEVLLSHELSWPSVWGQRVEIAYRGATPDDEATIDSYGGVFETPPYLVDLAPELRVGGVAVATGAAIGSAEDVEIRLTLHDASGFETVRSHETLAGEHHAVALDFGHLPQATIDRHQEAYAAALAAGDAETAEAEALHLLGAQYLRDLGTDLTDLSGWKQERVVRLGTEGLVSQSGAVSTTLAGTPLSLSRGARFIDVAEMTLGLFDTEGDPAEERETFELVGTQGSYLEGEIFAQVLERQGISAVAALTAAKREGQTLARVDAGNVSTVLGAVDLGTDVEQEIRSAVARGRIAWVAETPITVNRWTGTGYILEDPETGAAGYLISGGLAGGSDTGEPLDALQDLLGSEPWLEGSPLGALLRQLLSLVGGGGDSGGDGPSSQQSDPINLSTGNLWRTETDLTIQARGLPVLWSRTYNSRSTHDGALGHGWTFSYGESLTEQADGSVLYRESDGTEHLFTPDGAGGYTAPPGKFLTLTKDASGYRLRTNEGLESAFTSNGLLLSLSEPNGNTVTLDYDASGNLASVTDAAGRTVLTVTTDAAGRITRIEDLAGRTVDYGYTGSDLTSVTDTVGETWQYIYDSSHNLIGRSDPLGHADTYAYDVHDRCYQHVDPTGAVETFSYTSRGRRAVLTDRRGYDTYLELDERGRATLEVDPLGNAKRSTWDADNNRLTTLDDATGNGLGAACAITVVAAPLKSG